MIFEEALMKISSNLQDVFLSPEYYSVCEINKEGLFEYFEYSEGSKIAIYPFLKNSVDGFESVPDGKYYDIQSAYGYGGVLTNCFDPEFIETFYVEFDAFCQRKNIIAEFVRFHPLLENYKFASAKMKQVFDRTTVYVDLTLDYESIWMDHYTSKGRNVIRKAQKLGYTSKFVSSPGPDLIEEFHEIYSHSMRKVNADPFYFFSIDYFTKLFENLGDQAFLGLIYNENSKLVCTSIFLHHEDYFHYHLSGRTENADNSVNNFIIDEAVKFGSLLGAKKFHLGGGLSSDESDKLFKFKSSFSKLRSQFIIGKRVHNEEIYSLVVEEWSVKNPSKQEQYKNHLLKYRF